MEKRDTLGFVVCVYVGAFEEVSEEEGYIRHIGVLNLPALIRILIVRVFALSSIFSPSAKSHKRVLFMLFVAWHKVGSNAVCKW